MCWSNDCTSFTNLLAFPLPAQRRLTARYAECNSAWHKSMNKRSADRGDVLHEASVGRDPGMIKWKASPSPPPPGNLMIVSTINRAIYCHRRSARSLCYDCVASVKEFQLYGSSIYRVMVGGNRGPRVSLREIGTHLPLTTASPGYYYTI